MDASRQVNHGTAAVSDTTTLSVTWDLVHAEPGALVYAIPGGKPLVSPMLGRAPSTAAEWTPSGTAEDRHPAHHAGIEHPVLHYAGYIGRVGVLATALGVGAAIAGTPGNAWAEPNAGDQTPSPSEPSTTRSSNGDSAPAPQTGQRNSGGQRMTTTRQHSAPASVLRGAGEVRTSTTGGTDTELANPATRRADSSRLTAAAASAKAAPESKSEAQRSDSSAPGAVASTSGTALPIATHIPTTDAPAADAIVAPVAPASVAPAASQQTVTNRIVNALRAPFSSPTTKSVTAASQTPVLNGLFSWIRHTFDNQSPTEAPRPTENTQVDNARSPGAQATTQKAPSRTNGTVTGELHVTDLSSDTLVYSVAGTPSRGTVTLDPTTGAFTYTPFETADPGAPANQLHDTFTVTIDDSHGTTSTVPVSVDLDAGGNARVTTLAVSNLGSADAVHVSVIVTDHGTDPVTYLVVHDPAVGALNADRRGLHLHRHRRTRTCRDRRQDTNYCRTNREARRGRYQREQ